MYCGKTYLECYNFFQQCKDYFATAGIKDQNWIFFATTFLKNMAMFCWQQHQQKVEDKIDISITWKEFKVFFYQSLGKSKEFVDIILNIIWKDC